ncbi:methyltransferase domain-containing protein [Streptomyces pseudovenezuelae]|uniref:SAM-dependent methyltransferase n=1 Tax=Streptomyces pseudovenezuelae TaxID=67350 RepID=A0ABT6LJL7_9ACTN|nr:methyltransferase domain-containing protein [Streptomyces pseudovenezuelae]MDH6216480.1 SAM-dependent methyltransferase [Streptomyces pseudovenezuelae]
MSSLAALSLLSARSVRSARSGLSALGTRAGALRARAEDLDRRRRHRSTARALLGVDPEPESWLDVGTGHAHFPATAKELFPYTSFDGLDPTARVLAAREAERVEEAYVGDLTDPQLTRALRARYDVVTLLGPSTPDEELRAALTLLRPGGLLVLETPRPRSDALRTELESQGCTIVPPKPRRLLDRRFLDRFDRLRPTARLIARRVPSAP